MDDEIQNLINRFRAFPDIKRKPSFLEIAGFPHRETVWRNIFAFFFDPTECHGFKDLFLRSFFDALGKQDQDTGNFGSMEVSTECETEKGNRLDLLIRCHEFTIGIEMKVNAPLDNDLDDYGKLIAPKKPTGKAFKVVLSNTACKPYADFVNLLYADLIPAIKQQLDNYVSAADPEYTPFLINFLNHITSYIGGNAMSIDPKQLQFMLANRVEIERLINVDAQIQEDMMKRLGEIHESVKSLNLLKIFLKKDTPPSTKKSECVSEFHFVSSSGIRFYYQIWFGDKSDPEYKRYTYASEFWVDEDHLYNQISEQVRIEFEVTQPIPEIVKVIGEKVISIARAIDQAKASDKTINQKHVRKS